MTAMITITCKLEGGQMMRLGKVYDAVRMIISKRQAGKVMELWCFNMLHKAVAAQWL
jgi:hypothetical protein